MQKSQTQSWQTVESYHSKETSFSFVFVFCQPFNNQSTLTENAFWMLFLSCCNVRPSPCHHRFAHFEYLLANMAIKRKELHSSEISWFYTLPGPRLRSSMWADMTIENVEQGYPYPARWLNKPDFCQSFQNFEFFSLATPGHVAGRRHRLQGELVLAPLLQVVKSEIDF